MEPTKLAKWTMVRPLLMLCVLACVGVFGVGCTPDVSDKDIASIDLSAVRRMVQSEKPGSYKLVDARKSAEYRQGHLPGAISLPITALPENAKLDPAIADSGSVVVYGANPGSGLARGVAKRIYLAGQKKVRLFEGGFDAWVAAGLPVEKPKDGSDEPAKP